MQETYQARENRALVEVLGRALIDPDFRKQLEKDPEQLARDYSLSSEDVQKLKQIDPSRFDEASHQLSARADWRIFIGVSGHFNSTQ